MYSSTLFRQKKPLSPCLCVNLVNIQWKESFRATELESTPVFRNDSYSTWFNLKEVWAAFAYAILTWKYTFFVRKLLYGSREMAERGNGSGGNNHVWRRNAQLATESENAHFRYACCWLGNSYHWNYLRQTLHSLIKSVCYGTDKKFIKFMFAFPWILCQIWFRSSSAQNVYIMFISSVIDVILFLGHFPSTLLSRWVLSCGCWNCFKNWRLVVVILLLKLLRPASMFLM